MDIQTYSHLATNRCANSELFLSTNTPFILVQEPSTSFKKKKLPMGVNIIQNIFFRILSHANAHPYEIGCIRPEAPGWQRRAQL